MNPTPVTIRVEALMASGRRAVVFEDTINVGDTITVEDPSGLELTIDTKDPNDN